MNKTMLATRVFLIAILVIGLAVILMIPVSLPANIGAIDFRPYWSSSYLFARGQDFSDPSNLDSVERTLTGWNEPYTMYAWFAPTGNLVLMPYTFMTFTHATYYWLLTNIAIVFLSATFLWHKAKSRFWIPLSLTFGFSMTLVSLYFGQVNTLVVLGLALFIFLSASKRDFAAGISLVLTTIKLHIAILTLPILLLNIVWQKQWRILAGFVSTLIVCCLILLIFYPQWPISFWSLIAFGMSDFREVPTIAGVLVYAKAYVIGKWLWVVGLVLATLIWWKLRKDSDQRILIDVSILAGMTISPIGWSYDQIMLLIPLAHILEWINSGLLSIKHTITIALILIVSNALSFYQRIFLLSEVWFFWIPLIVTGIYLYAWTQKREVALPVSAKAG